MCRNNVILTVQHFNRNTLQDKARRDKVACETTAHYFNSKCYVMICFRVFVNITDTCYYFYSLSDSEAILGYFCELLSMFAIPQIRK